MKKLLILSLAIAVITAQAYPNAVIITSISDENISEGSWESSFVDISTEDQTSDFTPYEISLDQSSYDYSSDAISYSSSDWSSSSPSWDPSGSTISSESESVSGSSSQSSGNGSGSISWSSGSQHHHPSNSHQNFSHDHPHDHPHPHPYPDSGHGWSSYPAPHPMPPPVWSTDSASVISKQQLMLINFQKYDNRRIMIMNKYEGCNRQIKEMDISDEERRQKQESSQRIFEEKFKQNEERFLEMRKQIENAFDENGVPNEAEIARIKEALEHDQQDERRHHKGHHDGNHDNLQGHSKKHSQNIWKKVGKHILCFGAVALVITIIVKRCRRRRECRRRERMMHLQQQSQNQQPMPNSLPVASPVPSTSHRHLIPLQNPFSAQQHQPNHHYPVPINYQQNSPVRAPQRNDIYVPFNPQTHCNPLPKVAEVNKKEINIESREKEIEMRQLPKQNEHQNYRQDIASHPQQQQQDQVQYIPVKILPNGQMVILSPPCNNAPQYPPLASRTHFYPNLDSQVVVGSPVPNHQYNYPMKSQ